MLLIKSLVFFLLLKILILDVKLISFFAGIRGEGGRLDLLAGGEKRKNDKKQNKMKYVKLIDEKE